MFSKGNGRANGAEPTAVRTDANKAVPSIVSAALAIEGNMTSAGEIQIDGLVNGDIRCKALIVGITGSVNGEVVAQTVRLHGAIKGMVRAKSVFLASTARMAGDVEHESLAIEPGAYLEGHCRRLTESSVPNLSEAKRTETSHQGRESLRLASLKPAIAAT
ncbi:MAG: polymer-forming cytoskeletal protein [Alphaproteobacteria bacterium]|nr:polymer-forming cytoskeletal protein [Alphaproteobacteria bacterium]